LFFDLSIDRLMMMMMMLMMMQFLWHSNLLTSVTSAKEIIIFALVYKYTGFGHISHKIWIHFCNIFGRDSP